jgi:hypothetical protein
MKKSIFLLAVVSFITLVASYSAAQIDDRNGLNPSRSIYRPGSDSYPLMEGPILNYQGTGKLLPPLTQYNNPGKRLEPMNWDADPGILLSPKYFNVDPGILLSPMYRNVDPGILWDPSGHQVSRTDPAFEFQNSEPLLPPVITPFFSPGVSPFLKMQELRDAGEMTFPDFNRIGPMNK